VQAGCFFTPLSPSLLFKILTKTPTASSSINRCWQQHITCSIFKNPFNNMFSHLHITMYSISTEWSSRCKPHRIYRALPWSYSLPPVDGQHGHLQEAENVSHAGVMFCFLQKSYRLWSLKHNSTCLSSTKPA
jgi:hypothetical protein